MSLFVGPYDEKPAARQERETAAKAVCWLCPVTAPCDAFARVFKVDGVWGGTSEAERYPRPRGGLCGKGLHAMDDANVRVTSTGSSRCGACMTAANARSNARRTQRRREQRYQEGRAA
jgi:hypothetical protein